MKIVQNNKNTKRNNNEINCNEIKNKERNSQLFSIQNSEKINQQSKYLNYPLKSNECLTILKILTCNKKEYKRKRYMDELYINISSFFDIMRFFNYSRLNSMKFDSNIIGLLTSIHEAKGRQELYLSQKPEELDRLVEIAKAQSTEASNAIEGIKTTKTIIFIMEKICEKLNNDIKNYRKFDILYLLLDAQYQQYLMFDKIDYLL